MKSGKWSRIGVFVTGIAVLATVGARAEDSKDPSMHEIYVATQNGHLDQAKEMIGRVLEHHPKSAKAHYVAAEVYSRTCERERARQELQKAEVLQADLKFMSQQSVRELKSELAKPLPARCGDSV